MERECVSISQSAMFNGYSPESWPPHCHPAVAFYSPVAASSNRDEYIAHTSNIAPSASLPSAAAAPPIALPAGSEFLESAVLERPRVTFAANESEHDAKHRTGACTRCKRMKLRCELDYPYHTCKRCKRSRNICVFEERAPSKSKVLLAQIRQKDAMIASLLKGHRAEQVTPLSLPASKLSLPLQRPAHKDAPAASLLWRTRRRKPPIMNNASSDESSEEWSSGSEVWDADAAAAIGPAGIGAVYAHALPEASAPFGLLARLSLEVAQGVPKKRTADAMEAEETEEDTEWGIANPAYFQPGPSANVAVRRALNQSEGPPEIIGTGLVTWDEAKKLFEVFYEFVNPYVSVFDPVLHTPSSVCERCPFLFTVVCAISLRYHDTRNHIAPRHMRAMHLAKAAAATSFIDGIKSIELVQGYLLLCVYGLPARRWDEERRWSYGGLATTLAVDLGLYKPTVLTTKPLSELHARELRNRVRTWLNCFNVDRASSTQFGKPSGIHDETLVSKTREWYRGKYSHPYDLHLVMFTQLLCIMSRFHEKVYVDGMLNKKCDFHAVTEATEAELCAWHDDTMWRYENESDQKNPGCVRRTKGVPFFENYMRLVMYSFAFQDAWNRRRIEPGDMYLAKCLHAASAVIRHVIEVDAPSGYLKCAPDGDFVTIAFSAGFLLKLLRPNFASLIDQEQRTRIMELVKVLVNVLASPEVAVDGWHTSKLYSRFLQAQLSAVGGVGPSAPAPSVRVEEMPRSHSSDTVSGSSALTKPSSGPEDAGSKSGWAGRWTAELERMGIGLNQEEYLEALQAVASEWWLNNSLLMPGFMVDQGPHGLFKMEDSVE